MVVFDDGPRLPHPSSVSSTTVGSPAAWEKNQNVTFAGIGDLNGRPTIVLRLTKKIHSDILDHTLAYVDQASYTLVQMEWYYTSGGKITMTQRYRQEGGYWVLSGQHATIEIPHVRAVADASTAATAQRAGCNRR